MSLGEPARRAALVVGDEEMVRSLVASTLEEIGFAVCEAGEARVALEALRADPAISLMVTDLGLPGMNGRRLADKAWAQRPGLKVLIMTGYIETDQLEHPLPPDLDRIDKPFHLDDLAAKAMALAGGFEPLAQIG